MRLLPVWFRRWLGASAAGETSSTGGQTSTTDVAGLLARYPARSSPFFRGSSKPYTRWWWLRGPFRKEDIVHQLEWVKGNGFGGVEIAWLNPSWLEPNGEGPLAWLGPEFRELTAFARDAAASLELGCDFTFGSCWPFGGSWVSEEDACQTFDGLSDQRLQGSWEDPTHGPQFVVSHLSAAALRRYSKPLLDVLAPVPGAEPSALFCDSLELVTHRLWSPQLWEVFEKRFGYGLQPYAENLAEHPQVRYDYRKIISETICREFYREFTTICGENGAHSRVQCHGAPADLLAAYGAVDVPESEAILFEPAFSRIPASAAVLAARPVLSAETFTCIYGFPSRGNLAPLRYWKREQTADLKLLADSLFAHGVNQIVWHGMPYNPPAGPNEFYASVHVGPESAFRDSIPAFNGYLEKVSSAMKLGRSFTNLAVYLPLEDRWMMDRIPAERRTPGANYLWEMRDAVPAAETEGYHPVWISGEFLKRAHADRSGMSCGATRFAGLYVDSEWMDEEALAEILRLARDGMRVVVKRPPRRPGGGACGLAGGYEASLRSLLELPNVHGELAAARLRPLLEGRSEEGPLPFYWAREVEEDLVIFFAHPKAREVHYPMRYGQSFCPEIVDRRVTIQWRDNSVQVLLRFHPYQSLLFHLNRGGALTSVDIRYDPGAPLWDRL